MFKNLFLSLVLSLSLTTAAYSSPVTSVYTTSPYVEILIDTSNSSDKYLTVLCVQGILNALYERDTGTTVKIVTFGDRNTGKTLFTGQIPEISAKIPSLIHPCGNSPIWDSIIKALSLLESENLLDSLRPTTLFVVSDFHDNYSKSTVEEVRSTIELSPIPTYTLNTDSLKSLLETKK